MFDTSLSFHKLRTASLFLSLSFRSSRYCIFSVRPSALSREMVEVVARRSRMRDASRRIIRSARSRLAEHDRGDRWHVEEKYAVAAASPSLSLSNTTSISITCLLHAAPSTRQTLLLIYSLRVYFAIITFSRLAYRCTSSLINGHESCVKKNETRRKLPVACLWMYLCRRISCSPLVCFR